MITRHDLRDRLLRRRGFRLRFYRFVRNGILSPMVRRHFDIRLLGGERIPPGACVIATHHCLSFDWAMMAVILDRKAHGWFDAGILRRAGWFGSLAELIPVNTDGGPQGRSDYRTTRTTSRIWLQNTDEFVVTVTDGPSKHSVCPDGHILDLAERPNLAGGASAAIDAGVPVVPYASWIPPQCQRELFASSGLWAGLTCLRRHGRIPYCGEFCEPIAPPDFGSRRDLQAEIRRRQLDSLHRLGATALAPRTGG